VRAHALHTAATEHGKTFVRDRHPDHPGHRTEHFSGPFGATATTGPDDEPRRVEPAAAAGGRLTSVLVCDDRADVRRELSRIVGLRTPSAVHGVADGAALLNAYDATSTVQVMIGVHSGATVGPDAFGLLLGTHPTASPILFGSISDIDLLAGVYARGAGGLLLWELGKPWPANPVG